MMWNCLPSFAHWSRSLARSISWPTTWARSMTRCAPPRRRNAWTISAAVIVMLLMASCAVMPKLDNGARLIEHPDFAKVVEASAEWSALALEIIANLEARVEAGE